LLGNPVEDAALDTVLRGDDVAVQPDDRRPLAPFGVVEENAIGVTNRPVGGRSCSTLRAHHVL
jgi:hypothetical protein